MMSSFLIKKTGLVLGCLSLLASSIVAADSYQIHYKVAGMKSESQSTDGVVAPEPEPEEPSIEEELADAGADGVSCKDIQERTGTSESGTYKILVGGSTYDVQCLMPEGYTLVANIRASDRSHISVDGYGSVATAGSGTWGKLPDPVINELFTETLNLRCTGKSRFIPKSTTCETWDASAPTLDENGELRCANSFGVAHASGHLGVAHYNSSSDRTVYGNPTQNGCFKEAWGRGGELYVR